jgi:uncharacterized membrane protein YhhN
VINHDLISLKDASEIFEWAGAILGMIGATLLALHHSRISKIGWICFLFANFALIGYAILQQANGILLQQCYFSLTSLLGIYRSQRAPVSKN